MKKQPHKTKSKASPPIPRLGIEPVMRDIQKLLGRRTFASMEETNAFLATLTGPGLQQALDQEELSPREEAQDLAFRALEAGTSREARSLAKKALAKDHDCVDALVALAEVEANSIDEFIAGLEKAVAAGERSLGAEFFKENKGHFWGLIETRPYMRARQQLADTLHDAGRTAEAIGHYEALLELNPNDNQGVRDLLLGCYLGAGDLQGARRLLHQYKNDISPVFGWSRALERFLSGDLPAAERAVKDARRQNPFVELYLTARKKMPKRMPDTYGLGTEEGAIVCFSILGPAWVAHSDALFWVLAQIAGVPLPDEAFKTKPGPSQ